MHSSEQPAMDHLPYYREYLEQILRPRVVKLVDEVRTALATYAWNELLERMAEEQNPGASTDPEVIQKMRALLEQTLGLRMGIQLQAEFAPGQTRPAAANGSSDSVRRPDHVDVVDRGSFPDNPLARAVGGIKRPMR